MRNRQNDTENNKLLLVQQLRLNFVSLKSGLETIIRCDDRFLIKLSWGHFKILYFLTI